MREIENENPEYAVTKENIRKLLKEIAASRKRKRTQEQEKGKGKRKLIITESSKYEEELAATACDFIEDATANKILIETQFQRFVEVGAQQGQPMKAKSTNTSTVENVVDLVSTPPPPSPTKITQELIPEPPSISPIDISKNAMSVTLKEKFNRDRDLKAYIEKLPELLTSAQNISTKAPLFKVGGSRIPTPQPSQVPQRPRNMAAISSIFQRNPDKEATIVTSQTASIIPTIPEPHSPASEPTEDEEGENMEEIN